jgi:Protein of unknown function (DUF1360)
MQNVTADVAGDVAGAVREEAQAYRHGEDRPLSGYVVVMAVFAAVVGTIGLVAATGRRLPNGMSPYEVALVALGTHKLSRLLSKDAVTSPLRAPFTRYEGTGGPAEVMEGARTDGQVRHAVGELVTCPFCLDMWIATGFALGLVFAPRVTRLIAATMAALAGADFIHLAYAKMQQVAAG